MKKVLICIVLLLIIGGKCFSQSKSYHNPFGVPDELWETFKKGLDLGDEGKWSEAFPFLKYVADKGNVAYAQKEVAVCYQNGEGVSVDFQEAFNYMYKAATNPEPRITAFGGLADFYRMGIGTSKNLEEAFKWYRKGAGLMLIPGDLSRNQEIVEDMYQVGCAYLYGNGVKQDGNQAVYWLTKADEEGNRKAASVLAIAYLNDNLGLEKNETEGVKWLERAATLDLLNPLLFYYRGIVHRDGLGNTPIDKSKALKLFELAAELGYTKAYDEIRKLEK